MAIHMFATVGTTTFPFDRFSKAIKSFSSYPELDIVYQFGFSPCVKAPNVREIKFLDHAKYSRELLAADIVVSHAGIGSFIEMKRLSKQYLMIPRTSSLGEHVDDHQIELGEFLRSNYDAHVLMPSEALPLYTDIRGINVLNTLDPAVEFIDFLQTWLDT